MSSFLQPQLALCPWDFWGKILELVTMPSSRRSSWPRDQTCSSCIAGGFFTTEPQGKPYIVYLDVKIPSKVLKVKGKVEYTLSYLWMALEHADHWKSWAFIVGSPCLQALALLLYAWPPWTFPSHAGLMWYHSKTVLPNCFLFQTKSQSTSQCSFFWWSVSHWQGLYHPPAFPPTTCRIHER